MIRDLIAEAFGRRDEPDQAPRPLAVECDQPRCTADPDRIPFWACQRCGEVRCQRHMAAIDMTAGVTWGPLGLPGGWCPACWHGRAD